MKLLKALSIVLGILFMSSCSRSSSEEKDDSMSVRDELKPTPVKTAQVQVKNFDYPIETSGKVIPFRKQVFRAEYNGLLNIFNGVNNQVIKEGEIIAQFDRTTFELELARAQLVEYNSGLEYKSELLGFSKGSGVYVSDSVKRKLEVSSGFGAAKIDLMKAEQDFKRATLFAPFSGVVADVKVQIGSWTKSGDELFTIYTDKDLLAEVMVLETDIQKITTGQPAKVFPIAAGTRTFAARVHEINPMVDENGLVMVKLKIFNPDGLLPGMHVKATIHSPQHKTLVVPKSALVIRSGKPVVFTLEERLAKWNYVTVGLENDVEVEIKEGIDVDQIVIVSNNLQLAHDAPVHEMKE